MIIRVTFRSLDCDAFFQLAGIPNGTCTSSYGSCAIYPEDVNVPVRCWYLDEVNSRAVRSSIQNNFADIYNAGAPGDVIDVCLLHST